MGGQNLIWVLIQIIYDRWVLIYLDYFRRIHDTASPCIGRIYKNKDIVDSFSV